jgi:CHAT domain-containing protein
LLGPLAGRLDGQLLVVAASGVLEYIPFAALPHPDHRQRRLVEEHEVVRLPSASVLAVLRQQTAARTPAPGLVAILADPVFDADDPRLASLAPGEEEQEAMDLPPLGRLRSSSREAEAIVSLAGEGTALVALGFDANRELATSRRLAGYRFLHFATHAVVDNDHPELSAVVLSRFDAGGLRRDGRLRLHELYGLQLPADLVVLSACRTALGKEVRGEGLLGLTRGFLYAGAARVLVSLWEVADSPTAELMERFYRGLLQERLSPAAALRSAQRSMLADERWSAPSNWAGFVLQGDWR